MTRRTSETWPTRSGSGSFRLLGRDRPIGSVRRVSIGSRSLPALKAFLYGEQFYRRGLWDSALVYYDRAITQDSTFALAFKQMAMALELASLELAILPDGEEYRRKAVVLNHGLSPKDSMQIAADSFGDCCGRCDRPGRSDPLQLSVVFNPGGGRPPLPRGPRGRGTELGDARIPQRASSGRNSRPGTRGLRPRHRPRPGIRAGVRAYGGVWRSGCIAPTWPGSMPPPTCASIRPTSMRLRFDWPLCCSIPSGHPRRRRLG